MERKNMTFSPPGQARQGRRQRCRWLWLLMMFVLLSGSVQTVYGQNAVSDFDFMLNGRVGNIYSTWRSWLQQHWIKNGSNYTYYDAVRYGAENSFRGWTINGTDGRPSTWYYYNNAGPTINNGKWYMNSEALSPWFYFKYENINEVTPDHPYVEIWVPTFDADSSNPDVTKAGALYVKDADGKDQLVAVQQYGQRQIDNFHSYDGSTYSYPTLDTQLSYLLGTNGYNSGNYKNRADGKTSTIYPGVLSNWGSFNGADATYCVFGLHGHPEYVKLRYYPGFNIGESIDLSFIVNWDLNADNNETSTDASYNAKFPRYKVRGRVLLSDNSIYWKEWTWSSDWTCMFVTKGIKVNNKVAAPTVERLRGGQLKLSASGVKTYADFETFFEVENVGRLDLGHEASGNATMGSGLDHKQPLRHFSAVHRGTTVKNGSMVLTRASLANTAFHYYDNVKNHNEPLVQEFKNYYDDIPGCAYPENVQVTFDKWSKKAVITWDAVKENRNTNGQFFVYRYEEGNSTPTLVGSTGVNDMPKMEDSNVAYNKKYTYKVSFLLNDWASSDGPEPSLTETADELNTTPTFNYPEIATTSQENSVQLNWSYETPSDGNTQLTFKVWRCRDNSTLYDQNGVLIPENLINGFGNEPVATVEVNSSSTSTSWEDHNLESNCAAYWYRVSSDVLGGTFFSQYYGPATMSGNTEITSVRANRGTYSNVIKVQWDVKQVGTDPTRFEVFRRLLGSENPEDYQSVYVTSGTESSYFFADEAVQPGQFYQYKVVAQNNCMDVNTNVTSFIQADMGEADGFCNTRGVISGRVTYGTGTAVADACVLLTKNSDSGDNVSQFYSLYVTPQGGIKWTPTTNAAKALFEGKPFTFQMYVRPDVVKENGSTILEGGDGFALILKPAATEGKSELYLQVSGGEPQATGVEITNELFSNVSLTCDGSTGWTVRVVNGSGVQSGSVTATSALTWSGDAVVFGSDKAFTVDHGFTGYLDDVRLWSKALTDDELRGNYDRLLIGTENGLKLYWPMDEGVEGLPFAYDYSKTSGVANENHGRRQPNSSFSQEVPREEQLRLYGKTDTEGNYVIRGVPFSGEGTSYLVRPTLGVHEFSPKHQTRFVNMEALTHNGVDFTDVSSFKVSGTVYYEHTSIPLEEAYLYVDGLMASKDGEPIMTDAEGKFTVDVPIGDHFISVKKNGHTFVKDGRYPDDPNGVGTRATFEGPVSGLTFYDNTLVTVAGRVAGGDLEYDKPLGLGQGKNNIGKAVLRLEQENEKGYLNVPDPDPNSTTTTFDPNTTERQFDATYGSAYVPADEAQLGNKNYITVETDQTTGEWVAQLPPLRYKVTMVQIPSRPNEDMINTKSFSSLPVIDATNPLVTYTDSVEVDGTMRKLEYHASAKMRYKASSTIDLTENADGSFGMKTYKVKDLDKQEHEVTLYTVDGNGNVSYTYDYPIYQELSKYTYHLYAYERYTNYDGETAVTDEVPLSGKTVTIKNQYASTTAVAKEDGTVGEMVDDKLELDDEGKATYQFTAGFPNPTGDYTRGISISYDNNGTEVAWSQNETFKVIVLGGLPEGNNFVTSGPDKVLMILRDPPGTSSSATWTRGSSSSTTTINTTEFHSSTEIGTTIYAGVETATGAGIGFMVINDLESKINFDIGAEYEATRTTGDVTVSKTTTTTDISTNGSKEFVGTFGDVFVGSARNIIFGACKRVDIVWDETTGGPMLIQDEAMSKGEELTTSFVYDQFYIKNTLIPNFINLRDTELRKGIVPDVDAVARPAEGEDILYVTELPADDPRFGSDNDDEGVWGPDAVEFKEFDKTTGRFKGPSYTMILPVNYLETHEGAQDMIKYYNTQVKRWEKELMLNEKAKVTAIQDRNKWFKKNYSFSAGGSVTETVETEDSKTDYDEQTDEVNAVLGTEFGYRFSGLGLSVKANEKIGRTFNAGTDTETATTTTTSFTLAEDGEDDYMTVDVFDAPDGFGPIFMTMAGATSCPYEDEVVTEYYMPGTVIMKKTVQIEKPEITASPQLITGVPAGGSGNFKVTLRNLSETDEDVWFDVWVDPDSNPNGLSVLMDDTSLNYGTSVLVKAKQPMEKTITVSQMDPEELSYENVKIIMASQCQKDNTSTYPAISSETEFSVFFQPSCSDVKLATSHTLVNENTEEQQTLSISGYNYSLSTLSGIRLEYKGVNDANFNVLQEYVKTNDASTLGQHQLPLPALTGTQTLDYIIDLRSSDFTDKTYVFRAVTVCMQDGKEVNNESDEITIVRDKTAPQLMATPSPASGILTSGDDLVITFNEDIQGSSLTQANNFEVVGVLNDSEVAHDVALSLSGTLPAKTDATLDLSGKPFSASLWVNYQTDGTLLTHGTQNHNFSVAIEDGKLAVSVAGQKATSTAALPQNKWIYLNVSLDPFQNDESAGSIVNAGYALDTATESLISDAKLPAYQGNGPVSVGGNNLTAKVQELSLWNQNRSMIEAQADMHTTKSQFTNGLIGYWQLDEGHGDVAIDKARSRNMTLPSVNAWWISGDNYALTLDGTKAAAVNIGSLNTTGSEDYLVETWFKANETQSGVASILSTQKMDLRLNVAGKMEIALNGSPVEVLNKDLRDGQWHHVAVNVLKSTNGSGIIYVDGQQCKQISASAMPILYGAKLTLGSHKVEGIDDYNQMLKGAIDEVRIWKARRTASVIKNYMYTRVKADEPGLVAYYPMEAYGNNSGVVVTNPMLDDAVTKETDNALSLSFYNANGQSLNVPLSTLNSQNTAALKPAPKMKNVEFSFVASERQIRIVLNEDNAPQMEGCTINLTVKRVKDMNGNTAVPITWSVYVQQNKLRWQEPDVAVTKTGTKSVTFTATIENRSGESETWTLSGLPEWLTANTQSGTLMPQSSATLTFTVAPSLAIGNYETSVYLTGLQNIRTPLNITVTSEGVAPNWVAEESENTMTVMGLLNIDGVISSDPKDMVAAFRGNVCVGVGHPLYLSRYDAYYVMMAVYGDADDSDVDLTFKVFDASTGTIYPMVATSQVVKYNPDYIVGTFTNPIIFTPQNAIEQMLALKKGWTWTSIYVTPISNALDAIFKNNGGEVTYVKNKGSFAQLNGENYVGSLTGMVVGELYKVNATTATTTSIIGAPAVPTAVEMTIAPGWNWIGYNCSSFNSLENAFADLSPVDGDMVKGQGPFSIYDSGEWLGNLSVLTPGQGYCYWSEAISPKTFHYPTVTAASRQARAKMAQQTPQYVNTNYENNMSVVAIVKDGDEVLSGAQIAVMSGDEVRGYSAQAVRDDIHFVSVAGKNSSDKLLFVVTYKGFDYLIANSEYYQSDAVLGSLHAPYVLNISDATGIGDAMRLTDNVERTMDNVYDLQGRRIDSSMFNDQGSKLRKGVYIVNGQKQVK